MTNLNLPSSLRAIALVAGMMEACGGGQQERDPPKPIVAPIGSIPAAAPQPPAAPPTPVVVDAGPAQDLTPISITPAASGMFGGASGNVATGYTGIDAMAVSGDSVFLVGWGYTYRSTDRGLHFTRAWNNPFIRVPVLWAASRDEIYLGGEGGPILRSTDGAMTFTPTQPLGDMFTVDAIFGLGPDEVFVAGGGNASATADTGPLLARTTDHGKTWVPIKTPVARGYFYALTTTDGKDLLVAGAEIPKEEASAKLKRVPVILRSTDHGKTWSRVPSFPQTSAYEQCGNLCFTSGALLAASTNQLFMTRDLGKTWRLVKHFNGVLRNLSCRGQDIILGGPELRLLISRDLGATFSNPLAQAFPPMVFPGVTASALAEGGEAYVLYGGSDKENFASLFRRTP